MEVERGAGTLFAFRLLVLCALLPPLPPNHTYLYVIDHSFIHIHVVRTTTLHREQIRYSSNNNKNEEGERIGWCVGEKRIWRSFIKAKNQYVYMCREKGGSYTYAHKR